MKEGYSDLGLDLNPQTLSDITIQEEVNKMTDRILSQTSILKHPDMEKDIENETTALIRDFSGSSDVDSFKSRLERFFLHLKRIYKG